MTKRLLHLPGAETLETSRTSACGMLTSFSGPRRFRAVFSDSTHGNRLVSANECASSHPCAFSNYCITQTLSLDTFILPWYTNIHRFKANFCSLTHHRHNTV